MTDTPTLRRLIDLPGIDALELKALMKPRAADPDELYDFPEIAEAIDETARAAFGLTPDDGDARRRRRTPLPGRTRSAGHRLGLEPEGGGDAVPQAVGRGHIPTFHGSPRGGLGVTVTSSSASVADSSQSRASAMASKLDCETSIVPPSARICASAA